MRKKRDVHPNHENEADLLLLNLREEYGVTPL